MFSMASNTPPSPQMLEAALALAQAMTAIVANPEVMAEAEKARAAQAVLTDEQVAKYQDALQTIAKAEELNTRLDAAAKELESQAEKIKESTANLNKQWIKYDADVQALGAQQQRANERDAKLYAREKLADERDAKQEAITGDQVKEAARLVELDKALKKREDALKAITQAAAGNTPA